RECKQETAKCTDASRRQTPARSMGNKLEKTKSRGCLQYAIHLSRCCQWMASAADSRTPIWNRGGLNVRRAGGEAYRPGLGAPPADPVNSNRGWIAFHLRATYNFMPAAFSNG